MSERIISDCGNQLKMSGKSDYVGDVGDVGGVGYVGYEGGESYVGYVGGKGDVGDERLCGAKRD